MNKALYLGHSFHQKTKSSDFLLSLLRRYYDVSTIYIDPITLEVETVLKKLSSKHYDLLVIWQVMPPLSSLYKHISWNHGVFFPMYDYFVSPQGGLSSSIWKGYDELTIICFSKALFQVLSCAGFDVKYIQYFPQPQEINDWGDTKGVFFWQRVSQLNISNFIAITQKFGYEKIHWHKALDPGHRALSVASLSHSYQNYLQNVKITESTWFEQKEQLLQEIEKYALYMAPRLYEGIGMSFLDAMAMGRCVIAHDAPTMNEYIRHGENGLLYAWDNITDIDKGIYLSFATGGIKEMQQNAYSTIQQGYVKWEKEKEIIIDWCVQDTHPSTAFNHKFCLKKEEDSKDISNVSNDATTNSYLLELSFVWGCLVHRHFRILFYFFLVLFNSRFNRQWYINQYHDVRAMSPAAHYLLYGWREGRDPSLRFSTRNYILCNPDIRTDNICPLVHWKLKGKKEKRSL